MRTLALIVEYDGTHFAGFQPQTNAPTIGAELNKALEALFGHPVAVECAGRTDAGVHATGQVVSFSTPCPIELRRIPIAASALLRPAEIAVVHAAQRALGFSARRDALARTYRYRILNRPAPSPLRRQRAFHAGAHLDVTAMKSAALALVGEHDFRAFAGSLAPKGRAKRTVTALNIERHGDMIDLWITADSFLHQMVRIIVGSLVEIGRGKRPTGTLADTLVSGRRSDGGFTAPAHGLYLERVHYAEPVERPQRYESTPIR